MFMKPSGRSSYAGLLPAGRKKVELLIITQMPPFFDERSGRAEHHTSWLYLVPPFTLQRYELFLKVPNFFKEKCFLFIIHQKFHIYC